MDKTVNAIINNLKWRFAQSNNQTIEIFMKEDGEKITIEPFFIDDLDSARLDKVTKFFAYSEKTGEIGTRTIEELAENIANYKELCVQQEKDRSMLRTLDLKVARNPDDKMLRKDWEELYRKVNGYDR